MRAIQATEFGAPEVLTSVELPEPVPGPGEVLVDVAAADVMFLDVRLRRGWGTDFFPVVPPYIPGGAIAGEVVAVGDGVDPEWLGRRVAGHTAASAVGGGTPTGGYAERALGRAEDLVELPESQSYSRAAALVHDGRTALAVARRVGIRPGERVLITAAGGGLGVLLTQLATAAGARVVAAARGGRKRELAAGLGADVVVDYGEPGWVDGVRDAVGAVDVVLDGAGGALGGAALDVVADRGRFVGYGSAAGGFADSGVDAARARGVEVISLFDITRAETDWEALAVEAQRAGAAGEWEVVVGQSFPLADAAAAHAAIEAREAIGRTLLLVR